MQDKPQNTKLIYALSAFAAICYSSWVLGYFLNIHVAINGTASQLAALYQPYRLLFVLGDALALVMVFAISSILYPKFKDFALKTALILYAMFGVLSFYSSLVSLNCAPAVQNCTNSSVDYRVIAHNLVGLAGLLCLLASLVWVSKWKGNFGPGIKIYIFLWFLAGIVSFLVDMYIPSGLAVALSQRVFLCLTAITIYIVPIIIVRKT